MKINGIDLYTDIQEYSGGGIKVQLMCDEGPYASASVWTEETPGLPGNQFICKNYSENEGIDEVLIASGNAIDTGKRVRVGYVTCPVLELTETAL